MQWFESWFNSEYYHLLYNNRDIHEAQTFVNNLCSFLELPPSAKVLDLACGAGRHARQLASMGYCVTGLDLSLHSITQAKQYENEHLEFYVHDMRKPFRTRYYDAVFNFFTSFGYFPTEREHLKTLQSVAVAMRPQGLFVMDFLNTAYVLDNLKSESVEQRNHITFYIRRSLQAGFFVKNIRFQDSGGQWYYFEERVRAFTLPELSGLFAQAGMRLTHTLGNYSLDTYEEGTSPRLILVAQGV